MSSHKSKVSFLGRADESSETLDRAPPALVCTNHTDASLMIIRTRRSLAQFAIQQASVAAPFASLLSSTGEPNVRTSNSNLKSTQASKARKNSLRESQVQILLSIFLASSNLRRLQQLRRQSYRNCNRLRLSRSRRRRRRRLQQPNLGDTCALAS